MDGVFAAKDQMAIGAIKAVRESGLRIRENIKIIGFDSTFVISIVEPELNNINIPRYKMDEAAVEMLIQGIEDRAVGNMSLRDAY